MSDIKDIRNPKSEIRKRKPGRRMGGEALLARARRIHAIGRKGIINATSAWHDLTFTEKLVWLSLAGRFETAWEAVRKGGVR